MADGTGKRDDVAAGYLSERSQFIPDRPRQLEVLLRVVRSTEQPRVAYVGSSQNLFPDSR